MRPIRDIEDTRRAHHADPQRGAVHRSSLLAPSLPGCEVDVSFVNHFLLKRNVGEVACRVTAVDREGRRIAARTQPVREPRVHVLRLAELADGPVANYLIEFFGAADLAIPFPAVVVNHRSAHFLNSVHSYNRVLNDVFEDDEVNATQVREASIDVRVDGATDTFLLFTSGPLPCRAALELTLRSRSGARTAAVPVDLPRLCHQWVSLRAVFGADVPDGGAVLTVRQPRQLLFYGRLLAGRHHPRDGAIAANHSFYDCSDVAEYWPDARPSSRVYPLLDGFRARLRLYPIFSPCRLLGAVDCLDAAGRRLRTLECAPLRSPGDEVLDLDVSAAVAAAGLDGAVTFEYRAWPETGGTPRRINHQIVYEALDGRSPLAASAANSLRNPNALPPGRRTGLAWGQCAVGGGQQSRIALVLDQPDGRQERVDLRLYGEQGEVWHRTVELTAGAAWSADPAALVPALAESDAPRYLWYWAQCARPDLCAYSVTRNRRTGHCSGDHCF
jgi:hypothetical protein